MHCALVTQVCVTRSSPSFFKRFERHSDGERGSKQGERGREDRERDEERGRETFYKLVQSLNAHKSQDWTRLKPGAINSIWVSHRFGSSPGTSTTIHCLPNVLLRELDQKWHSSDSNWQPKMGCKFTN